jgi:hypothetical protein
MRLTVVAQSCRCASGIGNFPSTNTPLALREHQTMIHSGIAQRGGVLLIAVAIHGVAMYFVAIGIRSTRVNPSVQQRALELFYVQPKAKNAANVSNRQDINRTELALPITLSELAIPSTTPSIDLSIARNEAAANVVRQSQQPKYRSLDAPNTERRARVDRGSQALGTAQRFEGGEVLTWLDERCYISNQPPTGTLDSFDGQYKVCKKLGYVEEDLFDHLRPTYLGGPRTERGQQMRHDPSDVR